MEIELNRDIFGHAVQKAERVTGKSVALPILSSIVLEANDTQLTITSTNGELGLKLIVPCKITTPGKVAVPGNILSSYISSLPSHEKKITLAQNGGTIVVKGTKTETAIKCMSVDDFPSIPTHSGEHTLTLSPKLILEGFKSVLFCAAQSSIKPELSSVYMYADGDLVFVATDSFRLAEKKIHMKKPVQDWSVLIPAKNASEIVRILEDVEDDVEVKIDSHQASFSKEGMYLTSRVVNGSFPDYRQIIPKETKTHVTVLKQDLLTSFKTVSIFSDKFSKLSLHINPDEKLFTIKTSNVDIGESTYSIDAKLQGDMLDINFNSKYILDGIAVVPSSSIDFLFSGMNKLLVKGATDQSFMYLVMPMNR